MSAIWYSGTGPNNCPSSACHGSVEEKEQKENYMENDSIKQLLTFKIGYRKYNAEEHMYNRQINAMEQLEKAPHPCCLVSDVSVILFGACMSMRSHPVVSVVPTAPSLYHCLCMVWHWDVLGMSRVTERTHRRIIALVSNYIASNLCCLALFL
jgi:hypothetical protein